MENINESKKRKVVILGSGNIGMDLLYKVKKSPLLDIGILIGIDPDSQGLTMANGEGIKTSHRGINELEENPEYGDIVFDATSANAHFKHAPILKKLNKTAIDLTPAALGTKVVPVVNLDHNLDKDNLCLITCGGQAVIPIVHAIRQVCLVEYAEMVSSISSKSAGPGTRQNIDEFTATTARALEEVSGAKRGKAIMILNPAEPPVMMNNTIYCLAEDAEKNKEKVRVAINKMVERVRKYVPGYELKTQPIFEGNKITVLLKVIGAGDYLPKYAGNLDIMTSAAVATAEAIAKDMKFTDKAQVLDNEQ